MIVEMENSKGTCTVNEICVVCLCLGAELKFSFVLSMRKEIGIQINVVKLTEWL